MNVLTPMGKRIVLLFRTVSPFLASPHNSVKTGNQRGATLLELVAGILCLSLLYTFAFHHAGIWLNERYAYQARLELIQLIEHARLRSLSGGISLTLCGTKNFQTCDDDWAQGALLSAFQPAAPRTVPYVLRLKDTLRLHGPHHALEFFPDPEANVLNATFIICTPHGVGFPVIVNRVGRIRLLFPDMDDHCHST